MGYNKWLDERLARNKFHKPFDDIPTFFDFYLNNILELSGVRLAYFSIIHDAHHENQRLIVQAELDALAKKIPKTETLFVWCHDDVRSKSMEVYGAVRMSGKFKKSYYVHTGRGDIPRTEEGDAQFEAMKFELDAMLDDKALFPNCTSLGPVMEERWDFVDALRRVIAYDGVIVGKLAHDTFTYPMVKDRQEMVAYVRAAVSGGEGIENETEHAEFAYFTYFEDHGCHGTSSYIILKKNKQNK